MHMYAGTPNRDQFYQCTCMLVKGSVDFFSDQTLFFFVIANQQLHSNVIVALPIDIYKYTGKWMTESRNGKFSTVVCKYICIVLDVFHCAGFWFGQNLIQIYKTMSRRIRDKLGFENETKCVCTPSVRKSAGKKCQTKSQYAKITEPKSSHPFILTLTYQKM